MSELHHADTEMYSIPRRHRATENLHVVLWLLKDMCWAMNWPTFGVFMFGLTLSAAVIITWQTRRIYSDLMHNAAMLSWITANGYWMMVEFFLPHHEYLRYFAAIPFGIGLCFVGYFYAEKAIIHYRGRLVPFAEEASVAPVLEEATSV